MVYVSIGSCYSTTVTGIVIGIVTFVFGFALGVLLVFLILCVYFRLYQKSSPDAVHAQTPSHPLDQSLVLEYQDVHLKPATCSTSTIPVTCNTAYGHGGKVLGSVGGQHKEKKKKKNAAYGPIN